MHSRPPATGLTTAEWRGKFPALLIPINAVTPTQETDPVLVEAKKLDLHDSFTGDPYPHVVVVNGEWLLEDGHHRWKAQVEKGERYFLARVFVMSVSVA